jgi:hypothetical protein
MNTTGRWILAIILAAAIGVALFAGGVALARTGWTLPFGSGYNMMGYNQTYSGTVPYGMTGGYSGMMNGGMMGGYGSSRLSGIQPLSIDQAKSAIEKYLSALNNSDLSLKEVIIFDNQAYGRVIETSTGIGAFEVLVDPATLSVFPEYGPNMIWNLKYGMMSSTGGMMGGSQAAPQASRQMPVSADEAVQAAQSYLDTYLPGARAATTPDLFYGYYTIEILRNDKVAGMLSVNGYTRQVFVHTWHGNFVELSED